jgi:hypothetical protein
MSAPQPDNTGRIVRFGVFELDLEAGELRRSGVKLHLQEQPFRYSPYFWSAREW